jgi:energy-coupling factor transporter ATP-binding protein EcfA2
VGTLYILDEPSIGLHPRDEKKLIEILKDLRDLGNTVVVVEHEREMIEAADQYHRHGTGRRRTGRPRGATAADTLSPGSEPRLAYRTLFDRRHADSDPHLSTIL